MKSEARSAPVVGAPPRRARRLNLGSHRHVCNVRLLNSLWVSSLKLAAERQQKQLRPEFLRVDQHEQIADV